MRAMITYVLVDPDFMTSLSPLEHLFLSLLFMFTLEQENCISAQEDPSLEI